MSLDVNLVVTQPTVVYSNNITHNLAPMAREAGIYEALWRPENLSIVYANELIAPLTEGLKKLESDPEKFKKLNPDNGWGSYDGLVEFVRKYIIACSYDPGAKVEVCR